MLLELLFHWRNDAVTVMVALPAELPITTSVPPLTYADATPLLLEATKTSG